MNRLFLIATSLIAYAAFLVATANACDFSLGVQSCYSSYAAPVVAYQQQYVQKQYVAPVVLPQIQYAPQQAEYIVLPQKVEIVRPEIVLKLQQAVGYSYAAPAVKAYAAPVQKFYAQPFQQGYTVKSFQQGYGYQQNFQNFQKFSQPQNQGNGGGIIGRIQDRIQNRIADRQQFQQQQALNAQAFQLRLRGH